MTRAPSVSSSPGRSATSRWHVTGTDMSAAGSRRVRKTVAAPPRRESCAIWPSTQTSPRRPIQSAILRATVRTGQGASGDDGAVTDARRRPSPVPPPSCPRACQAAATLLGPRAAPSAGSGVVRLQPLQPVAQHPHVGLAVAGGLLVGDQDLHGRRCVAPHPPAQLRDREVVVALDRRRGAGPEFDDGGHGGAVVLG